MTRRKKRAGTRRSRRSMTAAAVKVLLVAYDAFLAFQNNGVL
jgi:hypothetical protein